MCFLLSNIYKSYYLLKGVTQFAECLNSTKYHKLNEHFIQEKPKYLAKLPRLNFLYHLYTCVFFSLIRNRNMDEIQAN